MILILINKRTSDPIFFSSFFSSFSICYNISQLKTNIYIYIYIYIYCGAKESRNYGPFQIKPKAHAEEKEMSEDEQWKSRLPGYTAEDDPVFGRPKSQKGKVPRHQRQSPRGSQRRFRAQQASHRSVVEKQLQEKLSPLY